MKFLSLAFFPRRLVLNGLLAGLLLSGCLAAPEPMPVALPTFPPAPSPTATLAPTPTLPPPTATPASPERLWIANSVDGSLIAVDPLSNQPLQTLKLDASPSQVVALGESVWAADRLQNRLLKARPFSGSVEVILPIEPRLGTILGAAGSLWASAAFESDQCSAGKVVRIDPIANRAVAEFPTPFLPQQLIGDDQGLWVVSTCISAPGAQTPGTPSPSSAPRSAITRIDPATNQVLYEINPAPEALGPATLLNGELWVASANGTGVYRLDPASGQLSGPQIIGSGLSPLEALTAQDGVLYAGASGKLYRFELASATLSGPFETGLSSLAGLFYRAGSLWVQDDADGMLRRIDPASGTTLVMIPAGSPQSSLLPERGSANRPAAPVRTGTFNCPDAPPQRLKIGMTVTSVMEAYIRTSPEVRDDNKIGLLGPGAILFIDDGPVCGPYERGAYIYWQIHFDTPDGPVVGWMAEGAKGRNFLEGMRPTPIPY